MASVVDTLIDVALSFIGPTVCCWLPLLTYRSCNWMYRSWKRCRSRRRTDCKWASGKRNQLSLFIYYLRRIWHREKLFQTALSSWWEPLKRSVHTRYTELVLERVSKEELTQLEMIIIIIVIRPHKRSYNITEAIRDQWKLIRRPNTNYLVRFRSLFNISCYCVKKII